MSLPEVCVVYLLRGTGSNVQVLLGRKRTGLGMGKVVAPGGKLEPGETPSQAAVREVAEEVGIVVGEDSLDLVGELSYPFPAKPAWSQKSWAFVARGDWGEPIPTDELHASWLPVVAIPFESMWDDARFWLADALRGTHVVATFEFGPDLATVARSDHPAFGPAY